MLLSTLATDTSRVLPILLVIHSVLSADPAPVLSVARTWGSAETLLWQQTQACLRLDRKHWRSQYLGAVFMGKPPSSLLAGTAPRHVLCL